jgi:maleylpyruvate isomerase
MSTLASLTDAQVAEPSQLPGWTRAHLLTHIARNADSHVRMLSAARGGEKVEQYAGGSEGRAAEIDAGASRSASELVADVAATADRLFQTWAEIPDATWDREVIAIHGGQPAWACVFSRWRETEMHHSDLDLGYEWSRWPDDFVSANLPVVAKTLDRRLKDRRVELVAEDVGYSGLVGPPSGDDGGEVRGSGRAMLAWLTGRSDGTGLDADGSLPEIGPWI